MKNWVFAIAYILLGMSIAFIFDDWLLYHAGLSWKQLLATVH